MYSKGEVTAIRQKFWTSFGMYMSPVPSASAEKVNWVNYKTGIKGIIFKMDVDKDSAFIIIEISLKDTQLQHQYFNIFNNFTRELKNFVGNDWLFNPNCFVEGKGETSIISVELKNVNISNEADWPTIISFLKQHIIGLDAFWADYKTAFELI